MIFIPTFDKIAHMNNTSIKLIEYNNFVFIFFVVSFTSFDIKVISINNPNVMTTTNIRLDNFTLPVVATFVAIFKRIQRHKS